MDDREAHRAGTTVPRDPPQQLAHERSSASSDNAEAFSEFYSSFLPTLVAFLLWQGARLPDATDIAQETMIEIYKRWSEIESRKAYARTAASRAWRHRMVKNKEDLVEHPPGHGPLLRESLDVEEFEQRNDVLRVLAQLPRRQREVMAWTLTGCTPAEIATELQISPEAVRANLMKARRALASHLRATREDER